MKHARNAEAYDAFVKETRGYQYGRLLRARVVCGERRGAVMFRPMQQQFVEVACVVMQEQVVGAFEAAVQYYARAAYLLGAVETVNGTTIEEIVAAARAVFAPACVCDPTHTRARHSAIGSCLEPSCACGPGCIHDGYVPREEFATAALFRAIAREALGQGKVADGFGEIRVRCACEPIRCPIHGPDGRPLTVPRLAIAGAES